MAAERETEGRNAQEQSSRLQTELNRIRQELQDKVSQEDTLRQQMTDKEDKTRKAIVYAKQKINLLTSEKMSLILPPLVVYKVLFYLPLLLPFFYLLKAKLLVSRHQRQAAKGK